MTQNPFDALGGGGFDMNALLQQAQQMQQQLEEAQAALDRKIPLFQANPSMRIRVTGHADERGSDEYNLALGQRRAAAAKQYLVSRGIAEGRIEIATAGEERPTCEANTEECYQQNRRDEFEIIAGGPTFTMPGM